MIGYLMEIVGKMRESLDRARNVRRLGKLQNMGMTIGKDVFIPLDTWIDAAHCYLISIGDKCRFGPNCVILAHDATMNEFLDAGKIGSVKIHESCSFGFGTVIMPGVEIGPRVVTAAYSVVTSNVPPDSVVSGNPAKVIAKLPDFIRFHKLSMRKHPCFPFEEYGAAWLPPEKRKALLEALGAGSVGYITGGYSGMLGGDDFYSGRGGQPNPAARDGRTGVEDR